jgi:hypothetical protein
VQAPKEFIHKYEKLLYGWDKLWVKRLERASEDLRIDSSRGGIERNVASTW